MIIDQLVKRIHDLKNPSVVGLDPRDDYLPGHLLEDNKNIADAILAYNKNLIDALYDIVPAVKPQIAFYEKHGTQGLDCYIETIRYAKQKGMLVIADIKRSDISSTAEAYADAHLSLGGAFEADFVTINPYLGEDAVMPFIDNARCYEKGLFVLVCTSNPGAGTFQNLNTPNGKLYEVVGEKVSEWGADLIGEQGYSSVCAVVGATHPEQAKVLRERMPYTFFLVPGFGVQGGTAEGVRPCFDKHGGGAIVNNSRGIIAAHKQPRYAGLNAERYVEAAREAALEMKRVLTW